MLNKDERTIAVYMKAGALMRLYKLVCYGGRQGDLDGGTWH